MYIYLIGIEAAMYKWVLGDETKSCMAPKIRNFCKLPQLDKLRSIRRRSDDYEHFGYGNWQYG
ncbi:hypothetical protein J42TS3_00790 [Paenibacillus vini]|uniref:Uncharacterized protein n=1 Tax=Paenibacillus vini TaxID=1476024 RepID=A0ABQ4M4W9_9BACL|nr:hypothetical protein J42TS3_00790 [Paenibacillus vini]